MRKTKSAILEAAHDTAKGLHQAGVMDQVRLREFDRLCAQTPSRTNKKNKQKEGRQKG